MNIERTNSTSISSLTSFGSSAAFSSIAYENTFGDSHHQRLLKGINGLTMTFSAKFENLTDLESSNIISFLQKQFDYEAQSYSNEGRFTNKRIVPFEYQPCFPYKSNRFTCLDFTHDKTSFNVSSITANMMCVGGSILQNTESSAGHNLNTDCNLSSAVIAASNSEQTINFSASDNYCTLNPNNVLYNSDDYRTAKVDFPVNIQENASSSVKLKSEFGFPAGSYSSQHTDLRNSIYLHNPNDCSYYPNKPKYNGGEIDFRMFDFRPSGSVSIQNSPKYRSSSLTDFYKVFNKYGFNPNLTNLQLAFDGRSDIEAKKILFFLESHLGYKKFCFHPQKDYGGNLQSSANTPPSKSGLSFFYCPEWNHTFNYLNNHSISTTFIECLSN
jgi:phage-related protein